MNERCPLSGGYWQPQIPDICRQHCEKLWEKAEISSDYDIYRNPEDIPAEENCNHDDTNLEFLDESLQSVDGSPLRIYTVVDQCMSCEEQYGEQRYNFDCLNN